MNKIHHSPDFSHPPNIDDSAVSKKEADRPSAETPTENLPDAKDPVTYNVVLIGDENLSKSGSCPSKSDHIAEGASNHLNNSNKGPAQELERIGSSASQDPPNERIFTKIELHLKKKAEQARR
jgi:hypothetical protein